MSRLSPDRNFQMCSGQVLALSSWDVREQSSSVGVLSQPSPAKQLLSGQPRHPEPGVSDEHPSELIFMQTTRSLLVKERPSFSMAPAALGQQWE